MRMPAWRAAGLLFLGCMVAASHADAAFEGFCLIAQPIDVEGPPPLVATVPYVVYAIENEDPAGELMLTTAPNLIWCDAKAQNRNLAAEYGIKFVREGAEKAGTGGVAFPRLVGDTLMVKVDLTGARRSSTSPYGEINEDSFVDWLVEITLWCGLRNARQRWPTVRYVRYFVQGDRIFHQHAGLYSLEGMAPPERFLYADRDSVRLGKYRVRR